MRRAVLALLVTSACSAPARAPAEDDSARALHALFDADWEYEMREHPTWASSLGDMRYGDRWDDVSPAAEARRDRHADEMLAAITRIPRKGLNREDALSWEVFRHRYAVAVEGHPFREHLLPINQRGGIQTADELADALPFKTEKDFADWNARLRAFPAYMDGTIALLAEGVKSGIIHPRVVMERVTGQIAKQIVVDPRKSPFYAPYKDHPGHDAQAAEAERAIASAVVPAFAKLAAFWTETYLPACKPEVGAWQLPDGAARYAYLARLHTTTKLTPDQIHAIGLREVGRIRAELDVAKTRAGFTGTTKELFVFLRGDPKFYLKDSAALMSAYKAVGQRIDPLLPRLFAKLPKTPYTVQAVPDNVAPDTTTAYYREPAADGSRPGTYFVNLYKPESRPTWEMMALSLHESVPGHHLQIALAMEQKDIPAFRRNGGYNAFVEGWALYAESLGDELGLYDDPWSKIGQLTYEMWRAVRLVVDTGIHHLKWDRQRAIDFFLENAPKAELDVVNEVDRYIAWPGQALSYKIGELKIKELRKKTKLDVKAFHEALLGEGALPLEILEQQMKDREPR